MHCAQYCKLLKCLFCLAGAELANVINESALEAVRRNGTSITMADIYNAMDRVLQVWHTYACKLAVCILRCTSFSTCRRYRPMTPLVAVKPGTPHTLRGMTVNHSTTLQSALYHFTCFSLFWGFLAHAVDTAALLGFESLCSSDGSTPVVVYSCLIGLSVLHIGTLCGRQEL